MQYTPYLEKAEFQVQIEPLFDETYLSEFYAGRRTIRRVARLYAERVADLNSRADIIWLENEALPWVPWLFESFVWPSNTPVVTDYDDAIFHRYDRCRNWLARKALGTKIDRVMKSSKLVMVGNRYLAERAHRAGAKQVEVIPTVVATARYATDPAERRDQRPRIGWIGTPETWRSFGRPYQKLIKNVAIREGAVCRIIGAGPQLHIWEPFEYLPWSEDTEVESIRGMDVGIMPLPDTPWTRGKCGYKLIQYMACGLPVVASPVGVNTEIVEHGVNGFLAETESEWASALATLIRDPDLRHRMGQAGRRKVEEAYSLRVHGPRVARLLKEVATQARR